MTMEGAMIFLLTLNLLTTLMLWRHVDRGATSAADCVSRVTKLEHQMSIAPKLQELAAIRETLAAQAERSQTQASALHTIQQYLLDQERSRRT